MSINIISETDDTIRVIASSVEEYMRKFYKPTRYHGRGIDYAAALLRSHERDFEKFGADVISHHDSITGKTVWLVAIDHSAQRAADRVSHTEK